MSWIILYCLYTLLQYNGWKTNDSNNKWKCAHSPNKTHASKWLNKPKIQLICTFFVCTYSFFNYLPLILMRLIFKAFPPFALFVSSHCPWLQCNARTHSHLLMRPSVRTSLELVTNASKPTIINVYYDVQFLLMQPFHLFIWTSFFCVKMIRWFASFFDVICVCMHASVGVQFECVKFHRVCEVDFICQFHGISEPCCSKLECIRNHFLCLNISCKIEGKFEKLKKHANVLEKNIPKNSTWMSGPSWEKQNAIYGDLRTHIAISSRQLKHIHMKDTFV